MKNKNPKNRRANSSKKSSERCRNSISGKINKPNNKVDKGATPDKIIPIRKKES